MSNSTTSTNTFFTQTMFPWIVWGLACLFFFYESLLQVSPSVMSNELMQDFGITSETLGLLAGIYFYSYAILQLPCGLLMDYFGPRRILTLATAVCSISTLAFAYTDSFIMASMARLMIGFGSAFAVVGTLKLSANWFSPNRFAFLTGLMITIGMIGAIFGQAPLALLIGSFGWRDSLKILGFIGILLTILIMTIIKDAPAIPVAPAHHVRDESETEAGIMQSLFALVKNSQLWFVALYGGLMYMSTPVFCGLWGVPFLMDKMTLTKAVAANYVSLVFVGWAIASPLWGIYSNRIGKRKPPLTIGAIGAFITCLFFIYAPIQSEIIMAITLLAFGIFSAGFLPAFALVKEICNKRYVATGLSFMNMMNMVFIVIAQPLIGLFLDKMWDGNIVDGVRVYALASYQTALAILPLGIFIALILLPFINETYCHHIDNNHKPMA